MTSTYRALTLLLLVSLTLPAAAQVNPANIVLDPATKRGGQVVLQRGSYDYAPTVMQDGRYRMWWCGGIAGDHILYAEADSLAGPWHAYNNTSALYSDVFQPTGNSGTFDGTHTCDPSVVRVNGTYYLYYGGETGTGPTAIGVAQSNDGINWTRLNGGNPIIVEHNPASPNTYGAGQPSALYQGGYFYLLYTDSTGAASNPGNGAGIYALRSTDPTFQSNLQELRSGGAWVSIPARGETTGFKLIESFSVDWKYSDVLGMFLIASNTGAGATNLILFDSALQTQIKTLQLTNAWREGPGVVGRPDGHLPPGANSNITQVPVDLLHAAGTSDVNTWDLAWDGQNLATGLTAAQVDVGRLLDGYLLQAAGLPLTLVIGGARLQFALAAPAQRLSKNSYPTTSSIFYAVPYGASLYSGNLCIGAPGYPAAFVLDDNRKWPVSCLQLITDDGSTITSVSATQYNGYTTGPALYCVQ